MFARVLYTIYGYGVFFGLIGLLIVPAWIGHLWLSLTSGKPHRAFQFLAMHIFRFYYKTLPFSGGLEVSGLENLRGIQAAVITPSHQSALDYPLIGSQLIDYCTLTNFPFARWALIKQSSWALGIRYMGKNPTLQSVGAVFKMMENTLKTGSRVIIFPEGTRNTGGGLLPFKLGAFRMAMAAKAPVIPVLIENSGQVLSRDSALFKATKLPIRLVFLKPVPSIGCANENELAGRVRQVMEEAMGGRA